jgi:hypothetical protein
MVSDGHKVPHGECIVYVTGVGGGIPQRWPMDLDLVHAIFSKVLIYQSNGYECARKVWVCLGNEISRLFMLIMYDERLILLCGWRHSQTDFQDDDRQPQVIFQLRFSRERRDFLTETDCRGVAECTANRVPV